jgi:hypothetical protein
MWYAYRISTVDFAIKAFSDTIVALRLTPEKQSSAAIRKCIRGGCNRLRHAQNRFGWFFTLPFHCNLQNFS